MKRELAATGFSASLWEGHDPRPWIYWRNKNGVLLPNRLPADDYSYRLYTGKGFSPVPDDIAEPELEAMMDAKIAAKADANVADHTHSYNKQIGSPCKVSGCPKTRTTPYKKRGTT